MCNSILEVLTRELHVGSSRHYWNFYSYVWFRTSKVESTRAKVWFYIKVSWGFVHNPKTGKCHWKIISLSLVLILKLLRCDYLWFVFRLLLLHFFLSEAFGEWKFCFYRERARKRREEEEKKLEKEREKVWSIFLFSKNFLWCKFRFNEESSLSICLMWEI